MSSFPKFEHTLEAAIASIRQKLAACDAPPSEFNLEIKASGRTLEGEVKVEFVLGGYYCDSQTKGGRLGPVLDEFARRHGWQKANAPVCLTFNTAPAKAVPTPTESE